MTRIFGLLLVGAIAFSAVESTRAADGQISDAQLASLGLGGMQKMSDTQGMAVRGKFVFSPTAILQLAGNTYSQLQGPLGTQAAGAIAFSQINALSSVNYIMQNKFPPPTGLNGYGKVLDPASVNPVFFPQGPFYGPYIINSFPGLGN